MSEETVNDSAPTAEENKDSVDRVMEALEPTPRVVARVIGPESNRRTFNQKPLSFIRKSQLAALLANLFMRASEEGGKGAVNEMLFMVAGVANDSVDSSDMVAQAESFITLIAAIGTYMPQFLTEFFILVLNVAKKDQEFFRRYIEENEDEGGLSDEEAIDIFKVFVEQNKDRFTELFNLATAQMRSRPVADQPTTESTTTAPLQ